MGHHMKLHVVLTCALSMVSGVASLSFRPSAIGTSGFLWNYMRKDALRSRIGGVVLRPHVKLASKFNLGDDLLKDLIPQAGLNLRSMIAGSLNVFCLCCFVAGLAMDKNLYRLIVGQITVVDFFAITAKEMLEYTSNMLRKGYAAASRSVQDGKEWSVKMSGEQARADRDNAKKQFPPGSIGNPLLQGN